MNHGVAFLLDGMLGKDIDIKLANEVAFRKADGRNHVYPIDHEKAQSTVSPDRMRRVVVTLEPEALVSLVNDLNPHKATSMRDRAAAEIDGAQSELENAQENMPLFGTDLAKKAHTYLLNDLKHNSQEQDRMARVVARIGALSAQEIDAIFEPHDDLKQVLPEAVQANFKAFLTRAQQSCVQYMEKHPEKFA